MSEVGVTEDPCNHTVFHGVHMTYSDHNWNSRLAQQYGMACLENMPIALGCLCFVRAKCGRSFFSFILFCFVQKQSMAFNYFPFSNQLKTELSKLSVGLQQDQEEYTIRVFDMTQCNKACHCAVQCKLRSIECSPVQPCVCASDHMLCCSLSWTIHQQGHVLAGLHPFACRQSVLTGQHTQLSVDPPFPEQTGQYLLSKWRIGIQLSMLTCRTDCWHASMCKLGRTEAS